MTTATKVRANAIAFTGKAKAERTAAYMQIAPAAFGEEQSRATTLAHIQRVLGKSPAEDHVKACRTEVVIGYVAARLPANECKGTGDAERLEFARDLVCRYAAPPKPGAKARALRHGQIGRRTAVQHRVVRNAEERAGQLFAELGKSTAKTNAQRNAAKAPRGSQAGKLPPAGKATPQQAQAVIATQPKPLNAVDAAQHVATQMTSLMQFCNKNAKLVPAAMAQAVIACQKAVLDEANAIKLRADSVK